MENVLRKPLGDHGLRLLFRDMEQFCQVADTIVNEQKLHVQGAGKNGWIQDHNDYPYYISIQHLNDSDYMYLDRLLKKYELSGNK